MSLPVCDVTMRFKAPKVPPDIDVDLEGRTIISDFNIKPYGEVIVFSDYTTNPDGTVDVTGDYTPKELTERMVRMGYQIAEEGLGRSIRGFDGVVIFSYHGYRNLARNIRELNVELTRKK